MRRNIPRIIVVILFFMSFIALNSGVFAQDIEIPEYVPGELLVKFKPETDKSAITSLKADFKLETIKRFKRIAVHHLKLPENVAVKKMIDMLKKSPLVEYSEPNYIRYLNTVPNDPRSSELWGMHNEGQTGGTVDADIDAPEAWDISTGNSNVVVAVIDSGMDLNHEDLAANLWTNPGEIPGNGVDDDGNGYIDDVHGWDFRDNDNNPSGTGGACVGHGTHTAGTIGAVGNNGIGVVGVNWDVTIMPLRALGPFLGIFCSGNDADFISAIEYYTDFGVRVSNNSYGGGAFSSAMQNAIRASQSVFVAAAGNENSNNDTRPSYPASYPLDNIVSVAATDHNDIRASFSNFGIQSVDLGAPGDDILSTLLNDSYGLLSGTSMASPHVAGAAGLLLGYDPDLTNMEIIWRLLKGTDPIGLQVQTGGRLNVFNSLKLISDITIDVANLGSTLINPGDNIDYQVSINGSGTPITINAMIYARLPNGTEITLKGPGTFDLPIGGVILNFTTTVPGGAPAGDYDIIGRVWTSGDQDFDEDNVVYTVQ